MFLLMNFNSLKRINRKKGFLNTYTVKEILSKVKIPSISKDRAKVKCDRENYL